MRLPSAAVATPGISVQALAFCSLSTATFQARALRRERQNAVAGRDSNKQQVRLEYDEQHKAFMLGGGQDVVRKILADLSALSRVRGYDDDGGPSPAAQRGAASPLPSPPPSRPTPQSATQSRQSEASFGCGMDGILAAPG